LGLIVNKSDVIQTLQLEPHIEGGYFRRTFTASEHYLRDDGSTQSLMSSIFYLLTDDSPIGRLHRNRSAIMHYWHAGSALRYHLLKPDGELQQIELGPDLLRGQQLQMLVPGGWWKATELIDGEFGLLSEAVCPGFDFADMQLANFADINAAYPQHAGALKRFFAPE